MQLLKLKAFEKRKKTKSFTEWLLIAFTLDLFGNAFITFAAQSILFKNIIAKAVAVLSLKLCCILKFTSEKGCASSLHREDVPIIPFKFSLKLE